MISEANQIPIDQKPIGPDRSYTISVRGKKVDEPIFRYIRNQFGPIPLEQIESFFGFVESCTMYGGRIFSGRQLSDRDVIQLNNAGIGLRIPLTNHFIERDEYESYHDFLSKYHHKPNSVITYSDELATWIKKDFPEYEVEASVIKNISDKKKLDAALEVYNTVVLPMTCNEDKGFLQEIEDKSRIRLFANGGCAMTCPSRICYRSYSKINKGEGGQAMCSAKLKEREIMGMVDFEIDQLIDMGFSKFKLLRARPGNMTGF